MNTINDRIVPFINRTQPVRARLAQHGLLELAPPATLIDSTSFVLAGENILLSGAAHPRLRYGCCAYIISQDGRRALPVIGCRAWLQAPLPAQPHTHPVWADLSGGLAEAASRIGDAMFDLNGAIVAARSWMSRRHQEFTMREGSALLLAHNTHVLCAAVPTTPPPPTAASTVMGASLMRLPPPRHTLQMAA